MQTYDVDIRSSLSSASSQIAKDSSAIPASLTTFGFVETLEQVVKLLRKFIRFPRSSKSSKDKTASRRSCIRWTQNQRNKLSYRRWCTKLNCKCRGLGKKIEPLITVMPTYANSCSKQINDRGGCIEIKPLMLSISNRKSTTIPSGIICY